MSYEYRSAHGVIRLVRVRGRWRVEFGGARRGDWPSASDAAAAVARRASGLDTWDRVGSPGDVPEDLLDWTPLRENL